MFCAGESGEFHLTNQNGCSDDGDQCVSASPRATVLVRGLRVHGRRSSIGESFADDAPYSKWEDLPAPLFWRGSVYRSTSGLASALRPMTQNADNANLRHFSKRMQRIALSYQIDRRLRITMWSSKRMEAF